ncbi:MAG: hypothetical protein JSS61_05515 [Verrucomicrobia bacterium]|nr:hypothetical protein [Verrucomicrobiota bacterium]
MMYLAWKVVCFLLFALPSLSISSLAERFKEDGYVEVCAEGHGASAFDALYGHFDALIEFLQSNTVWVQKLYIAKERFIRSKERNFYSTDFFGLYNESNREKRRQIAFYYSTHFHEFICSHYPEFNQVPAILHFFEACHEIQKPYPHIFQEAAGDLGIAAIFSSEYGLPPLLLKVVKYLPSYQAIRPHYDGSAFSLFLDSTDGKALLLSPYKSAFTVEDFASPLKAFSRHQILLIPGTLLTEFSIFPTPHIVAQSGKTRYAAIAFAMRPHYIEKKLSLPPLPNFAIE